MFWRRKSADPLLRMFLDTYYFNLLSVPRENAEIGDLYVLNANSKRASAPGHISYFLNEPITIPEIHKGEIMADIAGTFSNSISFNIGIGLLETFLAAFGASSIVTKVRAGFETKETKEIKYRFAQPTRDSVDVMQLGARLVGKEILENHPLEDDHHRYFLVTGIARTPSINIVALSEKGNAIDLDLEVFKIGEAGSNVSIEKIAEGEFKFVGEQRLAFGVELLEVIFEENKLFLRMPEDAINIRSAEEEEEELFRRIVLADELDDVFLEIAK